MAKACQKLFHLKIICNKNITNEENDLFSQFLSSPQSDANDIDAKMSYALQLFENDISYYLKNLMILAGFHLSEAEEHSDQYINFFSSFVFTLNEIYLNNNHNVQNNSNLTAKI